MIIWILSIAVTAAAAFGAAGIYFTSLTRRKVTYMLDALEDNETNFRFREDKGPGKRFNRTLNRIRKIFEKEKETIKSQEKYYGQMLDHVQTGIAVIDGDRIEYCNSKALEMLGITTFSSIRQLRRINPPLAEAFVKVTEDNEEKASCSNESSTMTFSVTASTARLQGREVKIVAFNDISSDMEENEADSWTRLIRVLTHEIMNTVTPIASLSETLAGYAGRYTSENMQADGSAGSSSPDLEAGLKAISASSRNLIKFVNSYRDLTHIPAPARKAFYLKDLIGSVLQLTEESMSEAGATCTYIEKTEDILLYADMGQISQIFINMLRNAVQAGATAVDITAEITTAGSIVINIANNGLPISRESQEEIFVPFFTTKPSGTGIGLSISRQIMRMHNGSIRLSKSDSDATVFTLIFR